MSVVGVFLLCCDVNMIFYSVRIQVAHSFAASKNCGAHLHIIVPSFVSHSTGCIVPNKYIFRSVNIHKYHCLNVFITCVNIISLNVILSRNETCVLMKFV